MLYEWVQWGFAGRRELIVTLLAVNIQGTKEDTFVAKCVLLAINVYSTTTRTHRNPTYKLDCTNCLRLNRDISETGHFVRLTCTGSISFAEEHAIPVFKVNHLLDYIACLQTYWPNIIDDTQLCTINPNNTFYALVTKRTSRGAEGNAVRGFCKCDSRTLLRMCKLKCMCVRRSVAA